MPKKVLNFKINEESCEVYAEAFKTLLEVIRDDLGLTGTKEGCGEGKCGVCTVLVNGKSIKSCLLLARQAQGKEITTIEGLEKDGELHPLQKAFIDHFAVQCGYCTPGMILTAKELLEENPNISEMELKADLSGNLCRCTGYVKIMEAVLSARDFVTCKTSSAGDK